MNILYILVPIALLLAALGAWAFAWAVRSGQYEDVDTPAVRLLLDEVTASAPSPRPTAERRPPPLTRSQTDA
ncbi:MAG: cbb3-type cytochrome oxidase assembly protein CcoS [Bacteroidota bacterium]